MRYAIVRADLPCALLKTLEAVCLMLGLQKNRVIEGALREEIEDMLDGDDLVSAERGTTGYHKWHGVRKGR